MNSFLLKMFAAAVAVSMVGCSGSDRGQGVAFAPPDPPGPPPRHPDDPPPPEPTPPPPPKPTPEPK